MQGFELVELINNWNSLKPNFDGVFSINTIPKVLKKRHFIFCNTDLNTQSGSHWQCLLRNDKDQLEYFDSLGITSDKLNWLAENCSLKAKTIKFNKTQVQLDTTDTCGRFCIYFIFYRLHNLDLSFHNVINDIFVNNCLKNENKVNSFFENDI